ncbi:FixH family protein [Mucilaginibacter aquatilis]|uniref:Nitrogen fixation protein FixH n=1 Tax=Mucilaginibacter aquatilis TaxID=1517760 RepID=A0A6I4I6U9_9SPHI|nr:FixH family protein [Mucilaginibacter aquatilis]MVN90587.1 nitrogen fixation protein FixH [Mucilaginibacter aquatilis]
MQMNWGKYLMLGMAAFMTFIISMGVYMFTQSKDDYDKLYYEKGLNYDQDYLREKQVIADKAQPVISFNKEYLQLHFSAAIKGKIYLTRAADRHMDRTFALKSDNSDNIVWIPLSKLAKGEWKLRAEWQSNQKDYLYQQAILIK